MAQNVSAAAEALSYVSELNESFLRAQGRRRVAGVITFGCQMNENDSEKVMGLLAQMGYGILRAVPSAADVRRVAGAHGSAGAHGLVASHGAEGAGDSAGAHGVGASHGAGRIDLLIFNTCCVRENAEQRFFGVLGSYKKLKSLNPQCLIAVCGCMAHDSGAVAEIKKRYRHVDFIFGTRNIHELPILLRRAMADSGIAGGARAARPCLEAATPSDASRHAREAEGTREQAEGTRDQEDGMRERAAAGGDAAPPMRRKPPPTALVSIMSGCDNFCTYCVVPHTRGREESRSPQSIRAEVEALAADGYREIVLLGQNVNSYGKNGAASAASGAGARGAEFHDLLHMLADVDGISRVRFMTSHPKDLSDALIAAVRDIGKVCRHIHLPVQSGSDAVLARMNRAYTRDGYLALIANIRRAIPDIALTTDIIVGFPGESERDFDDTLDLVSRVEFDMAYTFLYSRRRGTPAAAYGGQVGREAMKARFDRLIALQNGVSLRKNQALVGTEVEVLCEGASKNDRGKYTGRTSGGKIVNFTSKGEQKPGQLALISVTGAHTWSLSGEMARPAD
ncbi:MAG: MiaB/RimO family radical SAM methylthiotransferase [Clostridiales bacterium]|jgi:tRNA-2-methylthio-N6-dimethylallyladenosine synthase|nr:MiaB/RimO family radical SAM methylthiotransferase [Clostridiales bacterium]